MNMYTDNTVPNSYRTVARAGDIAHMPDHMATLTHPDYAYALSFHKELRSGTAAFLQPVRPIDDLPCDKPLTIKDGQVFFGDIQTAETDFRDMYTNESVHINTDMIKAIFSILRLNFDCNSSASDSQYATEDQTIDIYIPDLMEFVCGTRNYSDNQRTAVLSCIRKFHRIIGVIISHRNGRPREDKYAVLLIHHEKDSNNTLRLSSPYLMEILRRVDTEKRISAGKQYPKRGLEYYLPNYSYLIKGTIATARSRNAAEIVEVVVRLIEQCGRSGKPRISAATIIDRCPGLKISLDNYQGASAKNKMLHRTFLTAWHYLEKYTLLTDKYPDLTIPTWAPKMNTLHQAIQFRESRDNGGVS